MIDINDIAVPAIIEELSYEAIKADVMGHLGGIIDATLLESDAVMLAVEALIYREMLLRARINAALRACFLPTATGGDLDNIAVSYGVERLDGETDGAFRSRILMSLDRFSTAGSRGSYIYHTMSADARVLEAVVTSPEPGSVLVTYYAKEDDALLRQKIEDALSADTVRPLTDVVSVQSAARVIVALELEVELWLLSDEERVKSEILVAFGGLSVRIGEDLPLSRILSTAHVNGVYRVSANVGDVVVDDNEIAHIESVSITCVEAIL